MAYRYQFDDKNVGDLRLNRADYEILQTAYRMLHAELEAWNRRLVEHGASPPYQAEAGDLARMIAWGDEALSRPNGHHVVVNGISIGSYRYAKAALSLLLSKRQREREEKAQQEWPSAALRALDEVVTRVRSISDELPHEPSELLWEFIPKRGERNVDWDAFVSHASEDKDDFARPLAEGLRTRGLRIWFDEFELTVGDSLRRRIDHGLANSRFGIVIISPSFIKKEWPQKELDGLFAREIGGVKAILPVWPR